MRVTHQVMFVSRFQRTESVEDLAVTDQLDEQYGDREKTDEVMIQAMNEWKENQIEGAFDSWDNSYLLNDEVSEFHYIVRINTCPNLCVYHVVYLLTALLIASFYQFFPFEKYRHVRLLLP